MSTYVILGSFTEKQLHSIRDLTKLREAGDQWVEAKGGRVVGNYVTFGPYDFVFICDLPSDEIALEGAFTFGCMGNVRTQTLRAFPTDVAEAIAQKIAVPAMA
jgi:uncharacterized protein with GYD domain